MSLTSFNWKNILNAIPDMISVLDDQHRILWLNKKMLELLNAKFEDCIGRFCYEIVHDTDKPPEYCPYSKFLEDKEEHVVEVNINKLEKDFLVTVSPIKDDKDKVLGAIHIVRDVTELKEKDKIFSAVFMHNPIGMCISQVENGLILDVNDSWTKVTGYTRDEVIGKSVNEFNLYTNNVDRDMLVNKAKITNQVDNEKIVFNIKNGKTIYGNISVSVITLKGVKCWITAFVDRTESVRLKGEIEKLENLLLFEARESLITSLENNKLVK